MTTHGTCRSGRRGVALILVLGMLALLMILGIAFSVTMRAERSGAGNYAGVVLSKQLAWAALAQAIDHIDEEMTSNNVPLVYPPWNVLPSAAPNEPHVQLAWGQTMEYVPAGSLAGEAVTNIPQWVSGVEEQGVIGRYAYTVLNCSDMLDGNVVGGSNRWAGVSGAELVLRDLPDWRTAAGYTVDDATNDFVEFRADDVRYETLQELFRMQEGHAFPSNEPPRDFLTYSRYPQGSLSSSNTVFTNLVYIGGNYQQLASSEAQIKNALIASGVEASQAGFVFSNLVDYVDVDFIPGNLGSGGADLASACTEPVPMINEVVVTGAVALVGNMAQAAVFTAVEWFYPFIEPVDTSFELRREITATMTNLTTGNGVAQTLMDNLSSGYNSGVDAEWYGVVGAPPVGGVGLQVAAQAGDRVQVRVGVKLRMENAGQAVDAVPWPWSGDPLKIVCVPATLVAGVPQRLRGGKECTDPRFNWRPTSPAPWIVTVNPNDGSGPGASLGTTNKSVPVLIGPSAPASSRDYDTTMYVGNRGKLLSVGELGHLLRGSRFSIDYFRTIRLYDLPNGPRDTVLDRFTCYKEPVRRGLVNLNTRRREIIETAFLKMPKGYPDSGETITAGSVTNIVDAMLDNGPYKNVSDIGGLAWRQILESPGWRDAERDAAIAGSCQLLGTRQNLFTILLAAGPFSRGLGLVASGSTGDWLGTQRAVVLLWRDPYPDANGVHPCKVEFFKWISD